MAAAAAGGQLVRFVTSHNSALPPFWEDYVVLLRLQGFYRVSNFVTVKPKASCLIMHANMLSNTSDRSKSNICPPLHQVARQLRAHSCGFAGGGGGAGWVGGAGKTGPGNTNFDPNAVPGAGTSFLDGSVIRGTCTGLAGNSGNGHVIVTPL